MDVRVGLWRRLSADKLMLLNCGAVEDSWASLGLKEIKPANPKGNQSWIFIGRTDAEAEATNNTLAVWCEAPTHWKRPWCWESLRTGRERGDRGWDGCMTSPAQWTWVWANSGRWWWTRKPGVLPSMVSQGDMTERLQQQLDVPLPSRPMQTSI